MTDSRHFAVSQGTALEVVNAIFVSSQRVTKQLVLEYGE